MTMWGKPERIHVQKTEQLHAHDCHLYVTETSGHRMWHIKSTNTCTTQEQWVSEAVQQVRHTQSHGYALQDHGQYTCPWQDTWENDLAYTEMRWHGQMKHLHHIYLHALAPSLSDFNTGTVSQATNYKEQRHLGDRVRVFTSCESINTWRKTMQNICSTMYSTDDTHFIWQLH